VKHRNWLPDGFDPPESVETDRFHLRVLGPRDLAADYDAYMSSVAYLKETFCPPGETWPEGVTIEDALVDVCWCQMEFKLRSSCSYGVHAPDGSQEYGSLYVFPCMKQGFDAQLTCWVRESKGREGFGNELFAWGKRWVAEAWPFESVAYPGREISFEDFAALPDKPV